MRIIVAGVLNFVCITLLGQTKPELSFRDIESWELLSQDIQLSNNGLYATYTIENRPKGSTSGAVVATNGKWQLEIPDARRYASIFSENSKMLIFSKGKDSMGLLRLDTREIEYVSNVASFKVHKPWNGRLIACQDSRSGALLLMDLTTKKPQAFANVKGYDLIENKYVLVQQGTDKLTLFDINKRAGKTIAKVSSIGNITISEDFNKVAFTSGNTSIYIYDIGKDSLWDVAFESNHTLAMIEGFSGDGRTVLVRYSNALDTLGKTAQPDLDLWSYLSPKLPLQKKSEMAEPRTYLASIDWRNKSKNYLEGANRFVVAQDDRKITFLIKENEVDINELECYWNPNCATKYYLSINGSGGKVPVQLPRSMRGAPVISPEGKYLVYYDAALKQYYSYTIANKEVRCITQNCNGIWYRIRMPQSPDSFYIPYSIAGWLKNDAAMFLYDQNDVWLVKPDGSSSSINLTNGIGRKNQYIFRLGYAYRSRVIDDRQLLFSVFSQRTKQSGFYRKDIKASGDPMKLLLDDHLYFAPEYFIGQAAVKARNAEAYVIRQESTAQSPNYYFTRDFKQYKAISDVHPEKRVNWLNSELITWQDSAGVSRNGILYYPEQFDSSRKYPLIVDLYEAISHERHEYHQPEFSAGWMNIPWFVSKGYLIFSPDVYYKIGQPGESALQAVLGGMLGLRKRSYIDFEHLGLQGHSFGAFEANYIITHSNLFAAAVTSAGASDVISAYGSMNDRTGNILQSTYERGQYRLGHSLWSNQEIYVSNSPVLRANKVSTPLLMMNNLLDAAVPFDQGVEFFLALRRLKKPVWLLQYHQEAHSLFMEKNTKDFTIRMTQFFDHYLCGAAAPEWMMQGQ